MKLIVPLPSQPEDEIWVRVSRFEDRTAGASQAAELDELLSLHDAIKDVADRAMDEDSNLWPLLHFVRALIRNRLPSRAAAGRLGLFAEEQSSELPF